MLRPAAFPFLLLTVALLMMACAAQRPTPPMRVIQFHLVSTSPATSQASVAGTIATYNVHGLAQPQRLQRDLAALAFVETWMFQEVAAPDSPESAMESIAAILPAGEWNCLYLPLNPLRSGWWEGQLIATRHPIAHAQAWELATAGQKRRAALAAWIEAPNGQLLLVNTDHAPSLLQWRADNRQQLRSLINRLNDHHDLPVIVGGDFNTTGSLLALRSSRRDAEALQAPMRSAGLAAVGSHPTPTFRAGPLRLYLDHIFVRGVAIAEARVEPASEGSDHWPLWCRLLQIHHPK